MRPMFKLIAVIAVCACGSASAGERDEVPGIALAAPLKPYSEVENVIDAAESTIKLLASAKFDEPGSDSRFSKAPCDASDIAAIYKGMTLVQAGYFAFISKVERGFESVDSPHLKLDKHNALVPADFGALVRPGRELLVAVWDRQKLRRALSVVSEVRKLPADIRSYLFAYFSVLREFGDRFDALVRRAPGDLSKLNKRATVLYRYERASELEYAKLKGERELKLAETEYPPYVFYEDYAKDMRLLLDTNRDVGMHPTSECLDGGRFAAVSLGEKQELTYDPYGLYPASYLVGFWQRREFEGTSAVARFALDRLLAAIKSND